jgi:hypothetical protein
MDNKKKQAIELLRKNIDSDIFVTVVSDLFCVEQRATLTSVKDEDYNMICLEFEDINEFTIHTDKIKDIYFGNHPDFELSKLVFETKQSLIIIN